VFFKQRIKKLQLGRTQVAPCSRQINMPAPHHSGFTGWMPFLLPNQQHQSTEGTSTEGKTVMANTLSLKQVFKKMASKVQ